MKELPPFLLPSRFLQPLGQSFLLPSSFLHAAAEMFLLPSKRISREIESAKRTLKSTRVFVKATGYGLRTQAYSPFDFPRNSRGNPRHFICTPVPLILLVHPLLSVIQAVTHVTEMGARNVPNRETLLVCRAGCDFDLCRECSEKVRSGEGKS